MSLLSPNLEAFLAIVKNTTVHGAAREIGLTQTAVTQRIRALESSLSTTLFTRSRKGMLLTHEGEALLRYCQAARDLEGEALAKIQGAAVQSSVRVCMTGPTSVMQSRIIPQCLSLKNEYPELSLTFNITDIERRADTLRAGLAQFAIVPPEQVANEMDSKKLKPEHYILVGSKSWKKRNLKEITGKERIIDFDSTDTMSFSYLKKFKLTCRPDRHFVNNNESLIEMFQHEIGYGVLTKEVAKPYTESGSLIDLNPGGTYENQLALAWYPRSPAPNYFTALIKAVK